MNDGKAWEEAFFRCDVRGSAERRALLVKNDSRGRFSHGRRLSLLPKRGECGFSS